MKFVYIPSRDEFALVYKPGFAITWGNVILNLSQWESEPCDAKSWYDLYPECPCPSEKPETPVEMRWVNTYDPPCQKVLQYRVYVGTRGWGPWIDVKIDPDA
jgi:hypothetical protein